MQQLKICRTSVLNFKVGSGYMPLVHVKSRESITVLSSVVEG